MFVNEINFKVSSRQWQNREQGTILDCTPSLSVSLYDGIIVPAFEHDGFRNEYNNKEGKRQRKKVMRQAA